MDRSTQKLTTGRIPYFDPPAADPPEEDSIFLVRYLQSAGGGFVIRFFRVSFSIKLTTFKASGWSPPETWHLKP